MNYLIKPISKIDLIRAIVKALEKSVQMKISRQNY